LPVLRLLTPCPGATIRLCLSSRRTTRSSTATAVARRCYSTSLVRVPFHGRAAQRDCHRASVWTRYFSVEPYTERAGLNGTSLVNLSKDDCRPSAARRFSRFKSPGHAEFRQAGVASEPCARPVVRSSWSPNGWRLFDCARETVRAFQFHSFDRQTPARGPPWGRGLVCSFLSRGSAGPAFTSFRAGAQSRSSPRRQNPWATCFLIRGRAAAVGVRALCVIAPPRPFGFVFDDNNPGRFQKGTHDESQSETEPDSSPPS
jgi:hypothetical protein